MNSLYQAVLHRPDDLQLRHVLADALQDQGDPRGEFIALQLGRLISGERPSARERELLGLHRDQWLGRLVGLVHQPKFERGFVHHVQVLRETELPSTIERFEAWATVVSLDLRNLEGELEMKLLASPMMRSLREISGVSVQGVTALGRALGPMPWRHLSLRLEGALAALLRSPLPALTSLQFFDHLSLGRFRELLDSALGHRLTKLAFRLGAPPDLSEVLTTAKGSSLQQLRVTSVGGELAIDFEARLARAPRAFLTHHEVELPGFEVSS